MKGSALVPHSAVNVCGWFGRDADESLQKCERSFACLEFISLSTLAGLVDENGKTLPTAPGQYAPNSRVESFARENYKAAQVSAFNAA
jgi:hypothetical protein